MKYLLFVVTVWMFARGTCRLRRSAIGAYESPRVVIDPVASEFMIVKEFDDVRMTCLAYGHPVPVIRWSFEVGALSGRTLDPNSPQLYIPKIKRSECGRVTCRADNGIGNPSMTIKTIKVYYLDTPSFSIYPSKSETSRASIWFENTVYLGCKVKSKPPASFIWWKNGRKIRPESLGNGISMLSVPSKSGVSQMYLKIKDAKPLHFGSYQCQTTINSGSSLRIKDTFVNFTYSASIAPPQISLRTSETLVVNRGDRVRIICDVINGFPRPTISWIREDGILPTSAEVIRKKNTLLIKRVDLNDGGMYFCVGKNNVGLPVQKGTQLIVRYINPMIYWITPDPLQDDRRLALDRDMKLTCHADASPYSELQYSWYKLNSNNKKVKILNGLDPDIRIASLENEEIKRGFTFPEKSSRLTITTLTRNDYGQYICTAQLRGDVNMSVSATIPVTSDSAPARIQSKISRVSVREGELARLECFATGVPKPLILWQRDGNMTMPSGNAEDVTKDGVLTIPNASRDDAGLYTCTSARYNGFSKLKKQDYEDDVELMVLYPPTLEQTNIKIRTKLGKEVILPCSVIDANPLTNITYVWKKDGFGIANSKTSDTLVLPTISPSDYGNYTCDVSNCAGSTRCFIEVTGQAYGPEFMLPTNKDSYVQPSPPNTYVYFLSWTQKFPDVADPVMEYRVRWRRLKKTTKRGNSPPVSWNGEKQHVEFKNGYGERITCKLKNLVIGKYEIEVTPKTAYGYGDPSSTIIQVRSERSVSGVAPTVHPSDDNPFSCRFCDKAICGFERSSNGKMNWIWNNKNTQARRTPNTGPDVDHTKLEVNGGYMYIEASTTTMGDKACLLSAYMFDESRKKNCLTFYYHMLGKHIGILRVLQRTNLPKNDTELWRRSGQQGVSWLKAQFTVRADIPYRIIFEAEITRGNGYEGDIAIDDVFISSENCGPAATQSSLLTLTTIGNGASSHVTVWSVGHGVLSPLATIVKALSNPMCIFLTFVLLIFVPF